MTPNTIEFRQQDSTWVMRITADRRIEVNEDVEVTEAAKKVLEAMQWMLDNQKRPWVGLTDEDKQEWIAAAPAGMLPLYLLNLIEGIEAELKEKNT
jgi:hypothetical protein